LKIPYHCGVAALLLLSLAGCHRSTPPNPAEKERISRGMAKVEADQMKSDLDAKMKQDDARATDDAAAVNQSAP
jgi:uncharacterized OsmC-like protein